MRLRVFVCHSLDTNKHKSTNRQRRSNEDRLSATSQQTAPAKFAKTLRSDCEVPERFASAEYRSSYQTTASFGQCAHGVLPPLQEVPSPVAGPSVAGVSTRKPRSTRRSSSSTHFACSSITSETNKLSVSCKASLPRTLAFCSHSLNVLTW